MDSKNSPDFRSLLQNINTFTYFKKSGRLCKYFFISSFHDFIKYKRVATFIMTCFTVAFFIAKKSEQMNADNDENCTSTRATS